MSLRNSMFSICLMGSLLAIVEANQNDASSHVRNIVCVEGPSENSFFLEKMEIPVEDIGTEQSILILLKNLGKKQIDVGNKVQFIGASAVSTLEIPKSKIEPQESEGLYLRVKLSPWQSSATPSVLLRLPEANFARECVLRVNFLLKNFHTFVKNEYIFPYELHQSQFDFQLPIVFSSDVDPKKLIVEAKSPGIVEPKLILKDNKWYVEGSVSTLHLTKTRSELYVTLRGVARVTSCKLVAVKRDFVELFPNTLVFDDSESGAKEAGAMVRVRTPNVALDSVECELPKGNRVNVKQQKIGPSIYRLEILLSQEDAVQIRQDSRAYFDLFTTQGPVSVSTGVRFSQ